MRYCLRLFHGLTSRARLPYPPPRFQLHASHLHTPQTHTAGFSTSATLLARGKKKGGDKRDPRIRLIRYFLYHPRTPRPLRFSRLRSLRHWTIHRAWQLYKAKERAAHERELERQYNSMRGACEALRLMGDDGLDGGKNAGRLFRNAMHKGGVWDGIPIEYARTQTDYPPREGWNHDWKR